MNVPRVHQNSFFIGRIATTTDLPYTGNPWWYKVKVIDIDNVHHQARLSLKAVAKKRRFRKRKSIVETPKGFNPLREMMPRWISRGIAKEEDV